MSVKQTLIKAISNRSPLEIRKRGESGTRLIHPHILYRVGPELGINLDAWQLSNSDRPLDEPDWRTFNLEDITAADLQKGTFVIRHDFNPYSSNYSGGIIASVRT